MFTHEITKVSRIIVNQLLLIDEKIVSRIPDGKDIPEWINGYISYLRVHNGIPGCEHHGCKEEDIEYIYVQVTNPDIRGLISLCHKHRQQDIVPLKREATLLVVSEEEIKKLQYLE